MTILVGDIGGSNIRLSACEVLGKNQVRLFESWSCATAEFQSLYDVVNMYLDLHRDVRCTGGVFAVAAPTDGQQAELTNANWTANVCRLPFQSTLINDLEAAGWGSYQRGMGKEIFHLGSSSVTEKESSLLGVGTGFGLAHCFPAQAFVSPTEFGHVSFAPFDEQTGRLWKWWQQTQQRRLTIEDVCSGRGLYNLLRFVEFDTEQQLRIDSTDTLDWGERLSKYKDQPVAQMVWRLFFSILGSVCGDVIVGNRSHQLYLCGGVLGKNVELFHQHSEAFRTAMLNKAPMTHLVEEAMVALFLESKLQQYGCGLWYANRFE